jgi:alpha-beta hydrolase superfamily lysophospholipase
MNTNFVKSHSQPIGRSSKSRSGNSGLPVTFALAFCLAMAIMSGPNLQSPAAETKATDPAVENEAMDPMKEQEKVYSAHRPYVNVHFEQSDMDFAFQWILGATRNGGCEIGEAFYAASRMKDGDPESWETEWLKMAQRVEKKAEESLKDGHHVSARESYLRAANYYRAILVTMNPQKPECRQNGEKTRYCFKEAARLFDPPIEYIEIPFEGTVLPGYFIKIDNSRKNKTLIMIGGGETIAEDLYYYIAPETIERGYNFLTVDIPGQGLLPYEGKYFRPDTEVPLKVVVDYALNRPEVDPEGLAMYGISGGGYYVPRAASFDKRIKAIVVNSAVTDGYKLFQSMDFSSQNPEEIKKWSPFKLATFGVTAWRYGLDPSNIKGLAEVNKGHTYDPSRITCPVLVLIGQGEYANEEIQKQQHDFMEGVSSSRKKFVLTHENEGASSHCLGVNRSLMSEIVFNWMDETFSNQPN